MRRYFWLIPIFFMVLATLACDSPSYDPLRVKAVRADPNIPGKAYITVAGIDMFGKVSEGKTVEQVYETTDYGATWKPSTTPAFTKITKELQDLNAPERTKPSLYRWYGDSLSYIDPTLPGKMRLLWTFPRATFRFFFTDDDNTGSGQVYYNIDYSPDYDVSPADPHTVYIALGTEGVLIGANPENPGTAPRKWNLSREGLGIVEYLPLTITNPAAILGIIGLGLLVPPLSGLHVWLLAQVYRYAFQDGEKNAPYKLAGGVTAIITGLAAIAIYVWLTDANTDYYPIVAVMTLICMALGVGAGVWVSRTRGFSALFTRRMAIGAALVSVIVPAGVASIWFLWPAIIAFVFGWGIFRRALERRLDRYNAAATRWGVDRTVLGMLALLMGVVITAGVIALGFGRYFGIFIYILFPTITVLMFVFLLWQSRRQVEKMIVKKKNGDALESSLFRSREWYISVFGHSVAWVFTAGACAAIVFMGQAQAYTWFQTLLVTPAKYVIERGM
jgi:hypothetical protein